MPVKTMAAASGNTANARTSSNMKRSVRCGGQRPRQRADIVTEERQVVAGRRDAADRGRKLHDDRARPPREQLRCLFRLERLMHDHAYLLFADRRCEFSKPRRAWRHALLDLDHVDDVEPKAAREIGPGVVIGDEARGAVRGEKLLPRHEICLEAREKT